MKVCNNCLYFVKQKKAHFFICSYSKSERFNISVAHGKTERACKLYTPKKSPFDPARIDGMRFIEEQRDWYHNQDIWVIGSDPNLDHYPDNYFQDKVSIAITISCVAFPNSTYFLSGDSRVLSAIKSARPDYLKKCIIPLVYSKPSPRIKSQQHIPWWEDYGLDPIYLKVVRGKSIVDHTQKDWERMAHQIFDGDQVEFIALHTSLDFGIEVAAVLGASRIVLVGCSHRTTKYRSYACKRGMWIFLPQNIYRPFEMPRDYQTGEVRGYANMKEDTIRLKVLFEKYGIDIVKHRYDVERRDFVFEEIESKASNEKSRAGNKDVQYHVAHVG